ncbi:hypothetical protein [Marinitoga lauensis]|uniref:hypothetical protein n=1 Tax=Marinitoga lauensis TaxID=2201189 RepID=UPI001010AE17|nr:hypothetical protein [Marinitoga lauensis]
MLKNLFKNKNFILIVISDAINRFGDSIDKIVYPWMVYEITNSTRIMGILFAVNFIPQIVFLILGSNFIDSLSKKKYCYFWQYNAWNTCLFYSNSIVIQFNKYFLHIRIFHNQQYFRLYYKTR